MRQRIRGVGLRQYQGGVPVLPGHPGDQAAVGAGSAGGWRRRLGARQLRSWDAALRLLRRRSVSPALSPFDRLEHALAGRAPRTVADPSRQLAAVAVVFGPDPDSILLIRRAHREGDRWSGQMAFPGGRWSPEDPDLLTTARRETFEEVGVDLTGARLIGQLDDSAPRSSTLPPVIVRPFVFHLAQRVPLSGNHEVADASWVPLERLGARSVYRPYAFEVNGQRLLFPGYHLDIGVVWGMTERILTPVLEMIDLAPPMIEL